MKLNLQKLSYIKIGNIVNDFINTYHVSFSLPIPIEEIAEGKLGIEIIPVKNLRQQYDADGCLDSSLSRIFIDFDLYINNENRTRFTIAHEVGHLILHGKEFGELKIKTPEDIFKLSTGIADAEYGWLEYQAYTFAGHVLVPQTALVREIERRLGKIPAKKFLPEEIFPISQELLEIFKVSGEVLTRRLGKEGIIRFDGPI